MSPAPPITLTHWRRDPEREAATRPLDYGLIRRLFRYTRPYPRKRNWLLVMVVVRGAQGSALAWMLGALIKGPISHGDFHATVIGAIGFLALQVFVAVTLHFRQRLALELGEAVVHDLRRDIFAKLLTMPMRYYHQTKVGRTISRVTSDVEAVRAGVQNVAFVGLVNLAQMTITGALMLWVDGKLFLVVVSMAPFLYVLNLYFRRRFSRVLRANQESFSRVTATLAESVTGIRVTQGFVRQEINAGIFRRLVTDHSHYNLAVARASGIFLPLLELPNQFCVVAVLWLGGRQVLHRDLAFGELVQFYALANVFLDPVIALGNLYNQALTAMAGVERVFHLLDRAPDWSDPPTAREPPRLRGGVEFRGVGFGYDPARPVLHGISFTAAPGQTIALVGHTGSGKTTIINLLAKFYLPATGAVLLDGVDSREWQTDGLHRQMGIVPQQNFLFSGTVRENIKLGRPDATDAEIGAAADRLGCRDLIDSLPRGFDTAVGEHGSGLSVGQRQLVCFIRAMVADPRILILDEATSSVDTGTEHRMQEALARLLRDRTSFVVAHRLSTIRHADLVLVLEEGRIVERGDHATLVAAGGVYANLYRQFVKTTGI